MATTNLTSSRVNDDVDRFRLHFAQPHHGVTIQSDSFQVRESQMRVGTEIGFVDLHLKPDLVIAGMQAHAPPRVIVDFVPEFGRRR